MRGELRLIVRLARRLAQTSSSALNHLPRFLGRRVGKGPGQGLLLADELNMPDEGQILVRYAVLGRSLVQQPAHAVVHQHPAEELLAHKFWRAAAQHMRSKIEV